jgi:hypothetical protein
MVLLSDKALQRQASAGRFPLHPGNISMSRRGLLPFTPCRPNKKPAPVCGDILSYRGATVLPFAEKNLPSQPEFVSRRLSWGYSQGCGRIPYPAATVFLRAPLSLSSLPYKRNLAGYVTILRRPFIYCRRILIW